MIIWQAIGGSKEVEVGVARETAEGGGVVEEAGVGVDGVKESDVEAREGEELSEV